MTDRQIKPMANHVDGELGLINWELDHGQIREAEAHVQDVIHTLERMSDEDRKAVQLHLLHSVRDTIIRFNQLRG